ncbi:hypothetical protein D3Z56_05855 [Lachnospiraceae bacterium]|nr:hypothetical protein [Lachnospiraceae bacterium]
MTDLRLNLKAGSLKKFLAMFMAVCLTVLSVNVPVFAEEVTGEDVQTAAVTAEADVEASEDDAAAPEVVEEETTAEEPAEAAEEAKTEEPAPAEEAAETEEAAPAEETAEEEVFEEVVVGDAEEEEAVGAEEVVYTDVEAGEFEGTYVAGEVIVSPVDGKVAASGVCAPLASYAEVVSVNGDSKVTELNGYDSTGMLWVLDDAVVDGKLALLVEYPENKDAKDRTIEARVPVMINGAAYYYNFTIEQSYLIQETPEEADRLVDANGNLVSAYDAVPGESVPSTDKGETLAPDEYNKNTVTAENGLQKDYYAGDLEEIVVSNVDGLKINDFDAKGNEKKKALKGEGFITVTVYDGIAKSTKKDTFGTVIAVYKVKAGHDIIATQKVNALQTNYVDGKTFAGFKSIDDSTSLWKKGKTLIGKLEDVKDAFSFDGAKATKNMHVVATYTQDASQLYSKYVVYVPAGKKATVQATFRNVVKGEKITGEVTDPNGKELIKSVKANAKTGVVTITATKKTGTAFVQMKQGSKVLGSYEVHVVSMEDMAKQGAWVELMTDKGATSVVLDKNSISKTAQIIPSPSSYGLKYIVTKAPITDEDMKKFVSASGAFDSKAFNKLVKDKDHKTNKAITVAKTGKVTAKKIGTAYVYGFRTIKNGKTATVALSNPVEVTVKGTATSFKMTGGKLFKFKGDAYVNEKKTQNVKFGVKAKGTTSDVIAVRAINSEGKVVLGALNRSTKGKGAKAKYVDNSYYSSVLKGVKYTENNSLLVVATSPVGEQHYKMLKFEKK